MKVVVQGECQTERFSKNGGTRPWGIELCKRNNKSFPLNTIIIWDTK